MATAKKKPTAKKPAAKSTAKKPAAAKPAATKTTIPAGREAKLAEQALKLVDEAASVLRSGIREGAATTAKSRIAAKKKAHNLLSKASDNLSKAIGDGASVLQGLIGKL